MFSISTRATSFQKHSNSATGSRDRYGIVVDLQQPALSVEEYEAAHGGPVYRTNPDQCCHDRKLTVLRRVAKDFDAWASGIRRDQSPCRADTPIVRWDSKFALAKISPLACWTKKDVWMRIVKEESPTIRCTIADTQASVAGPAPAR